MVVTKRGMLQLAPSVRQVWGAVEYICITCWWQLRSLSNKQFNVTQSIMSAGAVGSRNSQCALLVCVCVCMCVYVCVRVCVCAVSVFVRVKKGKFELKEKCSVATTALNGQHYVELREHRRNDPKCLQPARECHFFVSSSWVAACHFFS